MHPAHRAVIRVVAGIVAILAGIIVLAKSSGDNTLLAVGVGLIASGVGVLVTP